MTNQFTTAVPDITWTPTGLVIPQEPDILTGTTADINTAFGGGVNPALETPQGQLATSLSAIVADKNTAIAQLTAQVDPTNATGFMQDAIGRIYFQNRKPGTPSTVQLTCIGQVGTFITAGVSQAIDTSNNVWIAQQTVQIGAGGNVTVPFAAAVLGPTPCPINTVNRIYTGSPGWDTCNNSGAGVPGTNVESTQDFEFRRQQSVAAQAQGSPDAVYGAVFAVAGVIDAYVIDNPTNAPVVVGSTLYTVPANSVYVAATGGAPAAIGQAIYNKKSLGCSMSGNTSVTITPTSGFSFPPPTYTYKYNIPTPTTYDFTVNIKNGPTVPGTVVADVTAAIQAQFTGTNGGQRARIGALLTAAVYYGPVVICEGVTNPLQVLGIFIGDSFSATGSVASGSQVFTVTAVSSGKITPGTALAGSGMGGTGTNPAVVVSQLTGTAGGIGTYLMSLPATANGSGTYTGTPGTGVQLGIDQQPVLGTVTVNLV